MTSSIIYQGKLRTSCVHQRSGSTIITDAPVDNQGKGEAFSPTDLVATALAACQLTTMGIYAQTRDINIDGATCNVTKIMGTEPRRIVEIIVDMNVPDRGLTDKQRSSLEHVARTCPVDHSLHPDLVRTINIKFDKA